MTYPRSEVVLPDQDAHYHCIARCVRRSFLCGQDDYTGKCFEHRKDWIRDRLFFLASIFAIRISAYAVMSNHVHTVLLTQPSEAAKWEAREIAERWLTLMTRRSKGPKEQQIEDLANNYERIELLRGRLSSISWFQRCLSENIARRANREDDVTGRFWEGRFKCIRLDGPEAVVPCAVYVDLNPIRANMANSLEESDLTSIQDRTVVAAKPEKKVQLHPALVAGSMKRSEQLLTPEQFSDGLFTTADYLQLVKETAREILEGKSFMASQRDKFLTRLGINAEGWVENVNKFGAKFTKVAGPATKVQHAAEEAGRQWYHGLSFARRLFS